MSADPIVIRQSDMDRFCLAERGYRDHPGYRWVPSEPIVIGSTVHAIIEEVLNGGAMSAWSEDRTASEVLRVFTADAPDLNPVETMGSVARLGGVVEEVLHAVREWERVVLPAVTQYDWLGVEVTAEREIGTSPTSGRPIVLQGTPDLVTSGPIMDWKTSRKNWGEGKAAARVQSPLYAFLSEELTGRLDVGFWYWVWARDTGRWYLHDVQVDAAQVDAALANARRHALMSEAEAWPASLAQDTFGKVKRGWWCSPKYCAAWEVCEFKGGVVDDVDLDATIPTVW